MASSLHFIDAGKVLIVSYSDHGIVYEGSLLRVLTLTNVVLVAGIPIRWVSNGTSRPEHAACGSTSHSCVISALLNSP